MGTFWESFFYLIINNDVKKYLKNMVYRVHPYVKYLMMRQNGAMQYVGVHIFKSILSKQKIEPLW